MARKPEARVSIRDFNGLVSNRGDLLGQPGDALVQVNLYCESPGKLMTRRGRRALSFTGNPGGSGDVLACYFSPGVDVPMLFTQTSTGQIVLGLNPA